MTDVAYALRADLHTYGLPRGLIRPDARAIQAARAASDSIELDEHGFESGDRVVVRAAEGGTMAAPLVDGTEYFVLRQSASRFQLAATLGGPAIDLTTDSTSMVVVAALQIDEAIIFYSRWADGLLPGNVVPLPAAPNTPKLVTGVVAQLAAALLLQVAGQSSVSLDKLEIAAMAQLQRYASGLPLRDAAATAPANLAVTALVRVAGDPRGWGSGGCIP